MARRCHTVTKRGTKIHGRFRACAPSPKPRLDRRSLRWKRSGKAWILVGCPRGHWDPKATHRVRGRRIRGRCEVGTRAAEVLTRLVG